MHLKILRLLNSYTVTQPHLPPPPPRATTTATELRERILSLHKTGMSTSEVARELGLSKTTVWRAVKAATSGEGQSEP